MKKVILLIVSVISIVFVVYCISDYMISYDTLTVADDQGAQNNYSHEDFYTEYLDLKVNNKNQDANDDKSATGDSDAILGDSIVQAPTTVVGNADVYNLLSSDSDFSVKALAMSNAYANVIDDYGYNFAIGLMANVYSEGACGVVEYSFSQKGAWGFKLPSGGTKIQNDADVDYLMSWDSKSQDKGSYGVKKGSCGVGCVQWSFGRRVELMNVYKHVCKDYSEQDLSAAETSYMSNEFKGQYASVATHCKNKSPEDCARIICKEYERPANTTRQASVRASTATRLSTLLSSMNPK